MIFIIMGVSGAGKTTVGKILAEKIGCEFYDADSYHSLKNIEKMSKGIPLTDTDREPWLKSLRELINSQTGTAVLACSALKKSYRDKLSVPGKPVVFIYLKGNKDILEKRLSGRKGHYADIGLLESQLQTLEEPDSALTLSIIDSPGLIVDKILKHYSSEI